MAEVFRSPQLTFNRAQYHIRDFDAMVRDFIDSRPWAEVIDKDSYPGQEFHKIGFTRELPDMLPCVLFDVVSNLRAVLDQTGYASAIAFKSPSLKGVKFPFGPSEQDFMNNLNGGCKDLPPEIRALFKECKAYKGGNNTLWAINEIANSKKHFALIPLIIGNPIANFSVEAIHHQKGIFEIRNYGSDALGWDAQKNELKLFMVPAGSQVDTYCRISFEIAIEGIETLTNQPAVAVLDEMANIVQSIMRATEAECRRTGLIA
jgi:hypothetical protein